jgi:DeoR/GlpR family transcriptional regulator of sugar metabolism
MSGPSSPPEPPPGGWAKAHRERREQIRERVAAEGSIRIDVLANDLGVSVMTIHRDLDELQRQGWLRKVRGGATAEPSAFFHGDVRHRMHSMTAEKALLANAALELVHAGQSIVLDDSTTALHLAQLLPGGRGPLTVVTNFMPTMMLLAGEPGIDLIGLGGTYFPAYEAFLGMHTVEAIRPLRADTLFMSTTAIVEGRCYHQSTETIQVKRALMESVAQRVLLVDHTKFSKRALHELGPLTAFDLVLVDSSIDEQLATGLVEHGVPLRIVPAELEAAPAEQDIGAVILRKRQAIGH